MNIKLPYRIYYHLKPFIPRTVQIYCRRRLVLNTRPIYEETWPIDSNAGKLPNAWSGWPDQKQFALVLTHDVETDKGQKKSYDLMRLELELGFRSCFYFVPERYKVSNKLIQRIKMNDFEVGIHGLNHDGKLYSSFQTFRDRSNRINHYLKKWKAVGFRSPSMHHNFEWIRSLDIEYDASTFDTDPFEPQSDGLGTIFPLWMERNPTSTGFVELPYTLPQDFTLFIIMKERNINIWVEKLDWIAARGGMALLNTHPDYMNFTNMNFKVDEYPIDYYLEFIEYIRSRYDGLYWHVLPREAAYFWRKRITELK